MGDCNCVLNCITNNPFRILGVFGNASKKDIVSSENKIKAFLKVEKDIQFPLDSVPNLPTIKRDLDSLSSAMKELERPIDELKSLLFWFIEQTPIDKIAFNHLTSGNIHKAIDIWSKVENLSSSLNLLTSYTILEDWEHVAECADGLLSNYNYVEDVCKLVSDTILYDSPQMIKFYLDVICEESPVTLWKIYRSLEPDPDGPNLEDRGTPEWNFQIREVLASYFIQKTENQLAEVLKTPKDDILERARKMRHLLKQIDWEARREVMGNGVELSRLKDKVASEGIQIAINLYNNSDDSSQVARMSLELAQLALNTSVKGSLVYQRCEENVNTLKDICSELPPVEIDYYDALLNAKIDAYENEPSTIGHALKFIRDCAPYLMSIKSVIGETHNYYVKVSTRVAAMVVNDVIDDFNKQSDDILPRIKNVAIWEKQKLLEQFKSLVTLAATAMYHLTFFGMEVSFKEQRFQKNYDIIKKQAIDCGAITPLRPECSVVVNINGKYKSCSKFEDFLSELDTRDEDAYFHSCKTVADCNNYLLIFPNGKFSSSIDSKVEECTYNDCDSLAKLDKFVQKYPNTKLDIESKREQIIFNSCKSANDFRMYLSKYPSGAFVQNAKEKIDDLSFVKCSGRLDYLKYVSDFPKGEHYLEALRIIDDIDFQDCKIIKDFENYLKSHPYGCHVDEANGRIDDLTFEACSNEQGYSEYLRKFPSGKHVSEVNKVLEDYRFWHNCETSKSRKPYKEYVAKFPNGIFRKEADKRLKSWWRDVLQKVISNKNTTITVIVIAIILIAIGLIWGADGYKGLLLGLGWISGMGLISSFFALFQKEWKPFVGFLLATAFCLGGAIGWDESERYFERQQKAREVLNEAINSDNIYSLYSFLYDYSDTKWADEAYSILYEKSIASGWKETIEYAGTYSDNEWGKSAYSIASKKCDSIFDASGLSYMSESDDYRASLDSLRNGSYKPLISLIENLEWENEETAWSMAVKNNTIDLYNKFIEKYPSSSHVAQAEKRIIDLEVNNVFSSSYDELPSMNRSGYSNSATSTINIYNNTSYTLTVMYSGKDSKKVVISPQGRVYVTLPNGIYKCVASISGNARNHAGTENLDGGSYEVEYYIITSAIPSYRRY